MVEASLLLENIQRRSLIEAFPQTRFSWHKDVGSVYYKSLVPDPMIPSATLIIAHEFFDALPVHQYKRYSEHEWHEVMVDTVNDTQTVSSPHEGKSISPKKLMLEEPKFRFVTQNNMASTMVGMVNSSIEVGGTVELSLLAASIAKTLAQLMINWSPCYLAIIDYGTFKSTGRPTLRVRKTLVSSFKHH